MSQSPTSKSPYRSEIDGLRAFAVLSVVAFHAFPSWLRGGFIGVDVFFVISGFLITIHIFENLDKGQFSFTDFFGRRIRRIFPALILVMASSLAFGWFALLADEFAQLGKHVASGAAFITNFILVDESGYFDNAAETKPMLHLWSLAVEEQFYILWPLVLWLAWKRKFNLLTITILVAVVSFYLNLRFVKSHPTETFFWPVGRFWELLSGSVLAWLLLYKSDLLSRYKLWIDKFLVKIIHSKEVEADGITTSNLMSFFGLLLLAYGVIRINESLSFPSKWALIPVLGTVLIIASGSKAWLNRIFLMNPIAVWFGLISYPLYLWHWPILSFLQIVEGEMPHRDARIIAVFLAIILAWFTYKFFETPIRKQTQNALKAKHLVISLCFLGVIAYSIEHTNGVQTRSAVVEFNSNLDELKRTVAKEKECLEFLGIKESTFDYCKIGTEGPEGVVAVIGDSHAHVAFPGISEGLKKYGLTTILLANSSCPPLLGSPWGRNKDEKNLCSERIIEIISNVQGLKNLDSVILFTRGPTYWEGNEPSSSNQKVPSLDKGKYFNGLQRTVDILEKNHVDLFYVTENPELQRQARSCLPRPFNSDFAKKCDQALDLVLARQRDYRNELSMLKGIRVLDANEAFCNEDSICFAVNSQNQLLYADDDHLSVIGSEWQFNNIIKPIYEKKFGG